MGAFILYVVSARGLRLISSKTEANVGKFGIHIGLYSSELPWHAIIVTEAHTLVRDPRGVLV